MNGTIDGFTREQRINMVSQITAGLLASGHYTSIDENGHASYGKCRPTKGSPTLPTAVEDANEILDAIIEDADRIIRLMSEDAIEPE